MRINEISEKYGVSKRDIDYWTNLGLIRDVGILREENGYRDYGPKAEEDLKLILIVKAMNVKPLEDYVQVLRVLPKKEWKTFVLDRIEEEINRQTSSLRQASSWAQIYVEED